MIGLGGAVLAAGLLIGAAIYTLPAGGRRRWLGVVGATLLFATPVNIAACLAAQEHHGGSPAAPSGGRYYVSSHGSRREVTEGVWRALRAHERVTWIATPVGLLAGVFLYGGYLRSAQDAELRARLSRRPG